MADLFTLLLVSFCIDSFIHFSSVSDSHAPHVFEADEAILLTIPSQNSPLNSPPESYLDLNALHRAIITSNADAVHPGYGFLSENPEFARLCQQIVNKRTGRHVVWIGPSPKSIEAVGDKISAKRLLAKHAPHIPLVPGYSGDEQSIDALYQHAIHIGFPVLLKASAGGGGKGMRVVRSSNKLRDDIEMAKSESLRSFGNDKLLLERYFEDIKHIEVQIIGDTHGNVYHCFERECSMQRRHQKVIEETPAVTLSSSLRNEILSAAVNLGQLINYVGVGTVEFLLDVNTQNFYFLEVNTRLQVEHPVTECITGLDLVELQLRVAQGESLSSFRLNELIPKGHAIELRLCAENPTQNFAPCTGTILCWIPVSMNGIRYDSGIEIGSEISIYYDSMIAKIIAWAPTRVEAISLLKQSLLQTICLGLDTNKSFLYKLLESSAFNQANYTTRFIEDHHHSLTKQPFDSTMKIDSIVLAAAMWTWCLREWRRSTWKHITSGYRNVRDRYQTDTYCDTTTNKQYQVRYRYQGAQACAHVHLSPSNYTYSTTGKTHAFVMSITTMPENGNIVSSLPADTVPPMLSMQIHSYNIEETKSGIVSGILRVVNGSELCTFHVANEAINDDSSDLIYIQYANTPTNFKFQRLPRLRSSIKQQSVRENTYLASMPCRVLRIAIKSNSQVKKDDLLMTVESMKMETKIYAHQTGKVVLYVKEGDLVQAGKMIAEVNESTNGNT